MDILPRVSEAERYLSQKQGMLSAYYAQDRRHNRFRTLREIEALDDTRLGNMGSDYVSAGIAFITNRISDPYVGRVGEATWYSMNQRRSVIAMTSNILAAIAKMNPTNIKDWIHIATADESFRNAVQNGIPLGDAIIHHYKSTEPVVFFGAVKSGVTYGEKSYPILTPEFIHRAKNKPIEALAMTVFFSSLIRDFSTGVMLSEKLANVETGQPMLADIRARATESHFLLLAIEENPKIQLPKLYLNTIEEYPDGLFSSNIPEGVLYSNPPASNIQNWQNN